jgi:Protein of unknown function (DUF3140)
MERGHDLDVLWTEFHSVVNVTSRELTSFLRTEASSEDGEIEPGREAQVEAGLDLGEQVANILAKRKADLTEDDVDTMRTVIEQVRSAYPDGDLDATIDLTDDAKRHWLMTLGHDPLKVR